MNTANRQLGTRLAIAACAMFGFGFALVPFYKQICAVTGINNLLQADKNVQNTQVDTSRVVMVQFDANTQGIAWHFKPLQSNLNVHPGQLVRADFEVENTLDRPVVGQAVPSYAPQVMATYLKKLECFCFTRQTLAPHEKRVMPVLFTLDAATPAEVNVMTLSYTFFEVPGTQG